MTTKDILSFINRIGIKNVKTKDALSIAFSLLVISLASCTEHPKDSIEQIAEAPAPVIKHPVFYEHKKTFEPERIATPAQKKKELKSRLEIGADYTHVSIKPHGHTSFNGNLGGMQGSYEYRPANDFYGAATLSWKQGNTHGEAGKRWLLYVDIQERLGYTFASEHKNSQFTLFTGLGYRHLGHRFHPKSGKSLQFKYDEFYVPIGLLSTHTFYSWLAMGLDFLWMPQFYPTVGIVPLKGARWTLKNKLANFFVKLPIDFTLTQNKRFHLIVNPFYERWEDGHTTAKLSNGNKLGLPGNTYDFWGVDLNFGYRF